MDQPYSVWADLLNKFRTSSEFVQVLWLIAVPVTVLGVTWLLMRGLRDIAVAMQRPRPDPRSLLVYGMVQDATSQWHVICHGAETKPLDWRNPPRELVGRVEQVFETR